MVKLKLSGSLHYMHSTFQPLHRFINVYVSFRDEATCNVVDTDVPTQILNIIE